MFRLLLVLLPMTASAADFEIVHTLPGHGSPVSALAWSPDGARLVVGHDDGRVVLWRGTAAKTLATLEGQIDAVAVAADGRVVATGWSKLRVWAPPYDAAPKAHPVSRFCGAVFTPDGRHLLLTDSSRVVEMVDAGTFATVRSFGAAQPHDDIRQNLLRPTEIAFAPDGERFAAARWDQQVKIFELGSGEQVGEVPGIFYVDWSPDGRHLLAATGRFGKRVNTMKATVFDRAGGEPRPLDAEAPGRFVDAARLITVRGGQLQLHHVDGRRLAATPLKAKFGGWAVDRAKGRVALGRRDGAVEIRAVPSTGTTPPAKAPVE